MTWVRKPSWKKSSNKCVHSWCFTWIYCIVTKLVWRQLATQDGSCEWGQMYPVTSMQTHYTCIKFISPRSIGSIVTKSFETLAGSASVTLVESYVDSLWLMIQPLGGVIAPVRGFWSWFGGVCSLTYCNGNFRVTMVSEPFNVIL